MPLPEFTGALGVTRAAHLLRRATFGATQEQIDAFASLTPQQAITQLYRQTLPDPVLPIDLKTGQEWMTTGVTAANSKNNELEDYFLGWLIAQMMSTGIPANQSLAYSAREKVVHFLHTHFTTIKSKVGDSRALYFQNQLYRLFALDASADPDINVKTLTVKVTVDNAMLKLLDGNLNVKGSVNENYARELLELYSIGRGIESVFVPDPQAGDGDYTYYTEQDVQAAAKVLSGWTNDDTYANLDEDTQLPRGVVRGSATNASSHDNGVKTFSARFGNAAIQPDPLLLSGANATEASALDEIVQLVDLIYNQEQTPINICWKIYRFFVYGPHTTDTIAAIHNNVIPQMVETLKANNYKLQPVIENLLCSRHFYEGETLTADDNFGGIIKSPIDLAVGTLRLFNYTLPDPITQTDDFYMKTNGLLALIGKDGMGMNFYEPYDVAGYEAYHQFPIFHRFWITPNTLARRYKFVRDLMDEMSDSPFQIDVYNYIKNNSHFNSVAGDARTLIIEVARYFLPVHDNLDYDDATADESITSKRMNYFKQTFLQGFDETYWTTQWNNQSGEVKDWLRILFNTMLQSPEYQLA